MNKVISRLLIFFLGVPLCLFLALWPVYNHLPMHIIICIVATIGAVELYSIFKVNTPLLPKPFVIICTGMVPVFAAFYEVFPSFTGFKFGVGIELITYFFIFLVVIFLCVEVFSAKDFQKSNTRVTASVFILLYCGYFPTFISKLTTARVGPVDVSGPIILVFLLMVFLCDSFAWFFGVLFGKSNRGIVKASPNKSIAGFAGGFLGSVAGGLAGYFAFRSLFESVGFSVWKMVVTGVLIAAAGIIGDLIESIFKRSAGVKDSGKIVIGRGGILDSIDSILLSAPIYYLCMSVLLGISLA